MKFIFSFILATTFLCANQINLSAQLPNFHKKIKKMIKKTWKGENIDIKPLGTNYEKFSFPDRQLYTLKREEKSIGLLAINKAYGCHIDGCDDPSLERTDVSSSGYEDFYYAIFFNLNMTIKFVKVLEYDSEYGYEICGKRWLRQFEGHKGCDLKYEQDIDGISGATVSAQSIISDIANLCWLLSDFEFDK